MQAERENKYNHATNRVRSRYLSCCLLFFGPPGVCHWIDLLKNQITSPTTQSFVCVFGRVCNYVVPMFASFSFGYDGSFSTDCFPLPQQHIPLFDLWKGSPPSLGHRSPCLHVLLSAHLHQPIVHLVDDIDHSIVIDFISFHVQARSVMNVTW